MISNRKIKEYGFNSINEYFEYIVTSVLNGQRKQSLELIKALSKSQRRDCLNYFEFDIESGELLDSLRGLLGARYYGSSWLIP